MVKPVKMTIDYRKLTALLLLALMGSGCTTLETFWNTDKYYLYKPSIYERAKARAIRLYQQNNCKDRDTTGSNCHAKTNDNKVLISDQNVQVHNGYIYFKDVDVSIAINDLQVSDGDVLGFAEDLKNIFRQRMTVARRTRLFSSTLQILSAASAAILGATGNPAATVAAVAGFSAIIPDLQSIFEAKDRAEAYNQGSELIEAAQGRFLHASISDSGKVENNKLTVAGADLHLEIVASLRLVEKAVTATIPSVEDIEKATGKYKTKVFALTPASLKLDKSDTNQIKFENGKPFEIKILTLGHEKISSIIHDHKGLIKDVAINDNGTISVNVINTGTNGPFTGTVTAKSENGVLAKFNLTVANKLIFKNSGSNIDSQKPISLKNETYSLECIDNRIKSPKTFEDDLFKLDIATDKCGATFTRKSDFGVKVITFLGQLDEEVTLKFGKKLALIDNSTTLTNGSNNALSMDKPLTLSCKENEITDWSPKNNGNVTVETTKDKCQVVVKRLKKGDQTIKFTGDLGSNDVFSINFTESTTEPEHANNTQNQIIHGKIAVDGHNSGGIDEALYSNQPLKR